MSTSRFRLPLQHLLRIALVLAIVVLIGFLSQRYKADFDWTHGGRNTLTEASQRLLERMPETVTFTAFTAGDAEMRRTIEGDLRRYARFKDNIEIDFVDPSLEPQRARDAGITAFNEVQVSYQGNSEVLRSLTEPAITAALQRLADPAAQKVLFLQGHGERGIDGGDPMSLSGLVSTLRETGLTVRTLNLAETPAIPGDTTVVVLARPQRRLLEGEQRVLAEWIEEGGNLIWMADPQTPTDFGPLNEALGVYWHDGVAVFPDFERTSGHPGIFLATGYPPNPVTQRLEDITVFPLVRSFEWDFGGDWRGMPFLSTPRDAWLETGAIEGDLTFDEDAGDIGGPLTIGATLTRDVTIAGDDTDEAQALQQRVVLLGNSGFATDSYLGEAGNQRLAVNLFQWAATRDRQLDITIPRAPDSSLRLAPWALTTLSAAFVIGLPLLLIGFGVVRWAVRRRR